MNGLSIQNLRKSFGSKIALDNINLIAPAGQTTALLGPSGCGKSTLLGLVAGLDRADSGSMAWNGKNLAGVPTHRRGFGLMFQDYALFPHLNVERNVAFGLRMAHLPARQIHQRVIEMLTLVGLSGFEQRDVNSLSGGEQQRVALARALAPRPQLLMLDEPLGALDRSLRDHLILELRQILRDLGQTALYVTHDQEEAFTLAEQVVLMNAGRIEQSGTPQELYLHPASVFAARFFGLTNLLPAEGHGLQAETPFGKILLAQPHHGPIQILLRPDAMRLDDLGPNRLQGKLSTRLFRGITSRAVISFQEYILNFDFQPQIQLPAEGETVTLSFDPTAVLVLPVDRLA